MLCCRVAEYRCNGCEYYCFDCHEYSNERELIDCHGIDCPLGIAHPAPCFDPKKGGVFPIGCGICRTEKLELIERNKAVQQVINVDNLPEAYIYTYQNFDNYYSEDSVHSY